MEQKQNDSSPKQNKKNQQQNKKLSQTVKKSFLKRGNSIIDEKPSLTTIVKKFSIANKQCKLCNKIYPQKEMDCFGTCQHFFCHFCIVQYSTYKIDIKDQITCPQEGCQSLLKQNSDFFKKLPKDAKKKYRKLLSEPKQQHKTLRRCPSENCEGKINIQSVPIQCKQCNVSVCSVCLLPQHTGQCSQYFQKTFENWKSCPVCSAPTEKHEEDNNLMTCPRQHTFCYVCLKNWSKGHKKCYQKQTHAQKQDKKFKNIPRWLRLILAAIMIPFFPVLGLLGIALGIVIVIVLTMVITIGLLWKFFASFKQSDVKSLFIFWGLSWIMMVSALWEACKQYKNQYFSVIKSLYSHKSKSQKKSN